MTTRLEENNLTLRLFSSEASAARWAPKGAVTVPYAMGWLVRTADSHWLDAAGELPQSWCPRLSRLSNPDNAKDVSALTPEPAAAARGILARSRGNTPIADLLRHYEEECCDHTDLAWVTRSALHYADRMEDSQVRCLLYVLACQVQAQLPAGAPGAEPACGGSGRAP